MKILSVNPPQWPRCRIFLKNIVQTLQVGFNCTANIVPSIYKIRAVSFSTEAAFSCCNLPMSRRGGSLSSMRVFSLPS